MVGVAQNLLWSFSFHAASGKCHITGGPHIASVLGLDRIPIIITRDMGVWSPYP